MSTEPPSVLFVCWGNICRSPALEASLKKKLARDDLLIDSAGLSSYNAGASSDFRMRKAAHDFDVEINTTARVIEPTDFHTFDHIIAVSHSILETLEDLAGQIGGNAKLHLASTFAPNLDQEDIPDPYIGGTDKEFTHVMMMVDQITDGIVSCLYT